MKIWYANSKDYFLVIKSVKFQSKNKWNQKSKKIYWSRANKMIYLKKERKKNDFELCTRIKKVFRSRLNEIKMVKHFTTHLVVCMMKIILFVIQKENTFQWHKFLVNITILFWFTYLKSTSHFFSLV